jgi:DEAD/DEAH box helicase domain-containing protein
MDALRFLSHIRSDPDYEDQIEHVQPIEARPAQTAELSQPLPAVLREALHRQGMESLYTHQAQSIEAIRRGENIVVQTGTASGKSLCYNAAVIESILNEPKARALYLFPTKALAQDQLRTIELLANCHPELQSAVKAGTFDGDTPQNQRWAVRDNAAIVMSNPDMLHVNLLPGHARWAKFFMNLKFVVIDELHTYRGIFGSNVANVIRRMRRICAFYGAKPQFITCTATIHNPKELAEQVLGEEVTLIDDDGSPHGNKYFVLWNPPETNRALGGRRSSNSEAQTLLTRLVMEGVQTIAFTRARVVAELLYRYSVEALEKEAPRLAKRLSPYRGGYLASDRREIEERLFSGELLGVTATTALELGIDVGALDACILVGFPGTIASMWQQAGRAGRRSDESVVFMVAQNEPIDQYFMRHPEFLFEQNPENAVIDPDNIYILTNHIMCATMEMPLTPADERFFGPIIHSICEIIADEGLVKRIGEKWYWSTAKEPARQFGLRNISDETFTVTNATEGKLEVIGQVDGHRAFEVIHENAVYLHAGENFVVHALDTESRNAVIERMETDYYTRPTVVSQTQVKQTEMERNAGPVNLSFGEVDVTRQVLGYSRVKQVTQEKLDDVSLDLPARTLETKALWLKFGAEVLDPADMGTIAGLRNVLMSVLPMFAMCDRHDIGGVVTSQTLGIPALFIYDRYPGGLGFAEKGYHMMEKLLVESRKLVEECTCRDGCPSCVGQPSAIGSLMETSEEDFEWRESRKATLKLLRRVVEG